MRIAVWHNLPSGGGKRALYYQVKGLVERGHSVECWCPSMADRSYLPLKELAVEHVVPFDYTPVDLPGKAGKSISRYINAAKRLRAMDKACKQSAKEIESGRFDILFANSCLLYHMPHIVRYVRGPKLLYLHEPYRPFYEANPTLPWIGRAPNNGASLPVRARQFVSDQLQLQAIRIQARKEWLNAHSCDRILANSHYSCESILKAYGHKAKVCYLGIDTSLFHHLNKPRGDFIVGLGSFSSAKGIEVAIKSVSLLGKPRPKLVWVGNGGVQDYLEEMIRLAASLEVEFVVKKLVSDSELIEILNRAALLLYTSRLEPFGLAPLEANACGTPVVAVAEGGVRETIKDGLNGFLVDSEPEAIARAIYRLLSDTALARAMGARACEYVKREWNMSASIARLEEHFFQVARSFDAQKSKVCAAL